MEWNEECQEALDKIKKYLVNPSILKPPKDGKPLILYLAIEPEALGAMLTQEDDVGVEHATCYLSKKDAAIRNASPRSREDLFSGDMGL